MSNERNEIDAIAVKAGEHSRTALVQQLVGVDTTSLEGLSRESLESVLANFTVKIHVKG